MTKRWLWTRAVAVLATGAVMLPGAASAQAPLSAAATSILQREGLIEGFFGGVERLSKQVAIGPDSRSDRAAILAGCESIMMEKDFKLVAGQFGYDQAVMKSSGILASAVDALKQARLSPEARRLLDETTDLQGREASGKYGSFYLGWGSGSEQTFACFLRVAKGLVSVGGSMSASGSIASASKGGAGSFANAGQSQGKPSLPPTAPLPALSAPPPLPSYSGYNSAEAQALIAQLLKPGSAASAAAMSTRPVVDIAALTAGGPASSTSRRDHAAARQAYDAGKSRLMHNSLNDATACLRVEPTGVRAEWGIEGRFRLVNACGFPVAASWCANTEECGQGRGNLWTILPGKDWPIFFADPGNPSIQVGGCRAGEAKRPLPSDAEISRQGGFSEARSPPVPAPGVSLLTSHRCE